MTQPRNPHPSHVIMALSYSEPYYIACKNCHETGTIDSLAKLATPCRSPVRDLDQETDDIGA